MYSSAHLAQNDMAVGSPIAMSVRRVENGFLPSAGGLPFPAIETSGAHDPAGQAPPAASRSVVRLDNHAVIARGFGAAAAGAVLLRCKGRLQAALGGVRLVHVGEDGLALVAGVAMPAFMDQLRDLCAALTLEGVAYEGAVLHPALSISAAAVAGEPVADGVTAEQHRKDMADTARLFAAVREERMFLVWQPIVRSAGGCVLYHEGLSRIAGEKGDLHACGDLIAAAERAGLAPAFDRIVMARALDELSRDPHARLGVNLSAASIVESPAWEPCLQALEQDRDRARRLVIEITETAPLSGQAGRFVERLRGAGCLIAVDDFGAGHAAIRRLLQLRPDIIKIDAMFTALALSPRQGQAGFPHGRDMLLHMVGLATTIAPVVVAEGVEMSSQAEMLKVMGVQWLQGWHAGRPALARGAGRDGQGFHAA